MESCPPGGGEGQVYLVRLTPLQESVTEGEKIRIIAGGEAHKGHVLIAGILAGFDALPGKQFLAAPPYRAVDEPRLTEAATADTAPEEFQHHPVLGDFRGGNNGFHRVVGAIHVGHNPLGYLSWSPLLGGTAATRPSGGVGDRIQGGHIEPGNLGGLPQELRLGPPSRLALR